MNRLLRANEVTSNILGKKAEFIGKKAELIGKKAELTAMFSRGRGRAYAYGRPGEVSRGLMGLGTITAFGVSFSNDDAFNDFVTGLQLRGAAGRWGGVSSGIRAQLGDLVSSAQGPRGVAMAEDFKAKAQVYANNIATLQPFGIGGRSDAQDSEYKNAMQGLKTLMLTYIPRLQSAIQADAADAAAQPAYTPPAYVPPSVPGASSGQGNTPGQYNQTGTSLMQNQAPVGGIPTWAKAVAGIVLLGVAGYTVSKLMKKKG